MFAKIRQGQKTRGTVRSFMCRQCDASHSAAGWCSTRHSKWGEQPDFTTFILPHVRIVPGASTSSLSAKVEGARLLLSKHVSEAGGSRDLLALRARNALAFLNLPLRLVRSDHLFYDWERFTSSHMLNSLCTQTYFRLHYLSRESAGPDREVRRERYLRHYFSSIRRLLVETFIFIARFCFGKWLGSLGTPPHHPWGFYCTLQTIPALPSPGA